MSDHRIEDIVEESVRLVLAGDKPETEKRLLVADLYIFQMLFDTSDTYGRLKPELDAIGYAEDMDGSGKPNLGVIAEIMALADEAGDRSLIHDWLAVLVGEIDDTTLIDETLPADFAAFVQRPDAVAIRAIAMRHDVHGFKRGQVKLPAWLGMARRYDKLDEATMDRRAMLRFLLDRKADATTIAADFAADRAKAEQRVAVLAQVIDLVPARGDFRYVGRTKRWGDRIFIFEAGPPPADEDGPQFYLLMEHHSGINAFFPRIGMRSGLIGRWQERRFGADDQTMHFAQPLPMLVPDKALRADPAFGGIGWKWTLDQSAKLLEECVAAIIGHWPQVKKLVTFYSRPTLAQRLDEESLATMMDKRDDRRARYGYLTNEVDMLFALACRRWDRGEKPVGEIAAIREQLLHIHPDGRGDRVECLARLEQGPAFPAELRTGKLRYYEETFPL